LIKLLIVDDEKLLRKGFIHMTDWQGHGYHIIGEAANGEEAMSLIDALRPDIVVTDIKMPGMDGVELIRAIKSSSPQIEVIVLSSYSDFPYVKESLQLGAADYILKASMSFEEVLNALEKVTGKLIRNNKHDGQSLRGQGLQPSKELTNQPNPTDIFYETVFSSDTDILPSEEIVNLPAIGNWNWKEVRPYIEGGELMMFYNIIVNSIFKQIQQGYPPEPYHLQKSLVELIYLIIHKLDEAGWDPVELQQNKIAYFRRIESAISFNECRNAFKEALMAIQGYISASGYSINNYSPTIKAIINFLHQKYSDPEISLGEVAQRFHLNKSYLSQLFKQQVGVNFQSYLTRIRITKAKKLLALNEPVNEVCLAVGIDNVSYFSQLFKRWTGSSPSEYAREYIRID
jgi:YesN/AraC family two-component response regulator